MTGALMVSTKADRSDPKPLGGTLTGKVAIYVTPERVSSVEFTFVAVVNSVLFRTVENVAPFDLLGTNADGTAKMLDLSQYPAGAVLTVVSVVKDSTRFRRRTTLQASLTVGASAPASVSLRWYGAKGDGITDDTVAIQKALDDAHSGVPITLDGGTYAHSGVLHVRVPGTVLTGGILLATNEATSALRIAAPDVAIVDLTVRMATTTKRWDAPAQAKIHLDHTLNTELSRVAVYGSAASGIFVQGCAAFVLNEVEVTGTRADAIHMTGGSHDGKVIRPIVNNPGDDGIAIVSYLDDGQSCHHISVVSPRLYGQKWGRAFSVVGGRDITFSDVYSDGSGCAAIYVAAEKSWNTYGCERILFSGGTLLNSNQVVTVDHGAVLVFNGQSPVMPNLDVTIRNMLIRGTRSTASRQLGVVQYGDAVQQRIVFDDITVEGGGNLWGTNAPPSVYTRTNWTWNGQPVTGVPKT